MRSCDFHPMRQMQRNPVLGRLVDLLADVAGNGSDDDVGKGRRMMDIIDRAVADRDPILAMDSAAMFDRSAEQMLIANATLRFKRQGRNVFTADPDLARMLARTDLGEARMEDLVLPYHNMFVAIPHEACPGGLPGRSNVIDGAYVTMNRGNLEIVLAGRTSSEGRSAWPRDEDPLMWLTVKAGKRLSDALADAVDDHDRLARDDDDAFTPASGPKAPISAAEKAVAVSAATIVLNIACYLTSAPEDVERVTATEDAPAPLIARATGGGLQSAKAKRTLASSGFLPVIVVGRTVGKRIARARETASSPHQGVAPHWRRGHWRLQKHGKGLVDTKLVWIWPVVVNAAEGMPEDQGRIYLAKG